MSSLMMGQEGPYFSVSPFSVLEWAFGYRYDKLARRVLEKVPKDLICISTRDPNG